MRKTSLFLNPLAIDTGTQTTKANRQQRAKAPFRCPFATRKAGMFRIYLPTMLVLVASGIVLAVTAHSTLGLAAGLVLLTVGSGGVSAGFMTRDTKATRL